MEFDSREHAGRLLAARLEHLQGMEPVVIGVTKGGLPVAAEVARRLAAPLDFLVVRKMRSFASQEPALAAIAEGGETYVNPTLVSDGRVAAEDLVAFADAEVAELAGRIRLYRGEIPAPRLEGRVVIAVDDFVASGAMVRAAARAVRQLGAVRIVVAVPVLSEAIAQELRVDVDEIVVLMVPQLAHAPSEAYRSLGEVTDESALECLRRAHRVSHFGSGASIT